MGYKEGYQAVKKIFEALGLVPPETPQHMPLVQTIQSGILNSVAHFLWNLFYLILLVGALICIGCCCSGVLRVCFVRV